MTDNGKTRRSRLSKLSKLLLLMAVPVFCLTGFAIWVHGKTSFTPDFLEKHGFKFEGPAEDVDYDQYLYVAEASVTEVVADFEKEMTDRGFDTHRLSRYYIEVSNGGMMLGYLVGNIDDKQEVWYSQFRSLSIPHRIQLATGWRLSR